MRLCYEVGWGRGLLECEELSKTLGNRLDQLVVDTTETAKKCIAMAREKGLGVITCLILEKQRAALDRMNQRLEVRPPSLTLPSPHPHPRLVLVQIPQGAKRLFDLIEAQEEKVRVAFYAVLQDTLVTDSLDVATSIAMGKSRRYAPHLRSSHPTPTPSPEPAVNFYSS